MNKELLGILPPKLLRILLALKRSGYRWTGNYSTYEEALAQSTGYEAPDIIDKTINHGVIEDQKNEISLVSNIQLISSFFVCFNHLQKKKVTVLDFGGATGSHYRFIRHFLSSSVQLQYTICETAELVKKASKIFSTKELFFVDNFEKYKEKNTDIVFSSGTLQCLPDPMSVYKELVSLRPEFIIINRFPTTNKSEDRITVQHVPQNVYQGSYPSRFFSRAKWENILQQEGYSIFIKWDAKNEYVFLDGEKVYYSGYVLKRKQ